MSTTVGIRGLRQNLSQYAARPARGESFRVTDRGREVGRLVPPSTGVPWLDDLVVAGAVQPARLRSDPFPVPAPRPGGTSISEALLADRPERLP